MAVFPLSVFTDEISQDLDVAIAVCRDYGLSGVDIRTVGDKPPQDLLGPDADRIRKTVGDSGLRVASVASPVFKCAMGDGRAYAEHLSILERCIDLALALESPLVRTFTFWREGDLTEARTDAIACAYEKPIEMALAAGIRLGIENESSCAVGTGEELATVLDRLDSEWVGAIWDPGNVFDEGRMPTICRRYDTFVQLFVPGASPVVVRSAGFQPATCGVVRSAGFQPATCGRCADGYRAVAGRLLEVHVKDAVRDPAHPEGGRWVAVGDGEVGWEEQFRALMDDGFEGFVSLETHWRPEDLSEDQVRHPGGSAYSSAGELASRICLDRVVGMLKTLVPAGEWLLP